MENSDNITNRTGRKKKKSKNKKNNVFNPSKVDSDDDCNNLIIGQAVSLLMNDCDHLEEDSASSELSVSIVENSEENPESRVTKDGMMKAPPEVKGSSEELNELGLNEKEEEQTEETVVYNKRALSKDATTYELENFQKKILIIFNQLNIVGYTQPRTGTEKDVEALTNTFENFGFDVVEHTDLTKDEIFREMKTLAEMDFTDYGCVGVAVLTHGSKNGRLRAKDRQYSETEILNYLKVHDKPTLVTKPKILIIQACRGTESMQGVGVMQACKIRKDHDREVEPYYLPVESDMLVLHSSYIGGPSIRVEGEGSWFIQSLCNKINKLAPAHDVESIITEVKREVAVERTHKEFNRRTSQMEMNKQMPVMTSTLIRKLYLNKYKEETLSLNSTININKSSANEVLDSSVPSTPLRLQFGPCSCFLDHFEYMRNCLRHHCEHNPDDAVSGHLLETADTFEDGVSFNNSKERLLRTIFAKPEFMDYGCVGVAVLTHGSKNGLLRAKDQHYNEAEIINYFNKPTLVTKPKILIIQACRGTEGMQGVGVMQASKIRKDNDREVEPYYLPVESDMLIVHSSYIGGPSIRVEGEGSWFIRSLCNKVNELAPAQDLESIIMEVKREVAIERSHEEFNRRTSQIETNKQMPVMMSTLLRKLYLLRYKEESPSLNSTINIKKSSGNKALDTSVPTTHLQQQFGKCTCFLDHFEYMISFLRYYVNENPQDLISERLLEVADTFEDEVSFNKSKESMLRTICQHLMTQDSPYHKFLYFYKS